jgi:hypothetical protein
VGAQTHAGLEPVAQSRSPFAFEHAALNIAFDVFLGFLRINQQTF